MDLDKAGAVAFTDGEKEIQNSDIMYKALLYMNQFDGLLISGEVKLAKPSKEIYELAISKFKLIPEKTIFIDDRLENINTASSLGFNTVHLKNPYTIKEKLKKFI